MKLRNHRRVQLYVPLRPLWPGSPALVRCSAKACWPERPCVPSADVEGCRLLPDGGEVCGQRTVPLGVRSLQGLCRISRHEEDAQSEG